MDKRKIFLTAPIFLVLAFIATAVWATTAAPKNSRGGWGYETDRDGKSESRWVEETLKALSLRERIGQMVMTPVQVDSVKAGGERFDNLARLLDENKLGGIIVRGGSPAEVAALTTSYSIARKYRCSSPPTTSAVCVCR